MHPLNPRERRFGGYQCKPGGSWTGRILGSSNGPVSVDGAGSSGSPCGNSPSFGSQSGWTRPVIPSGTSPSGEASPYIADIMNAAATSPG